MPQLTPLQLDTVMEDENAPETTTSQHTKEKTSSIPLELPLQSEKEQPLTTKHSGGVRHLTNPQSYCPFPTIDSQQSLQSFVEDESDDAEQQPFVLRRVSLPPVGGPCVSESPLVPGSDRQSWSCAPTNERTTATEILPGFLFLGSQRAANDPVEMSKLGITRYLCCAFEAPLPTHVPQALIDSEDIRVAHIPMKDGAKTSLEDHFSEAFRFLREAKRSQAKVLVYCREGKSRSASIVIGYLIRYHEKTYEEALEDVRARRTVVDPNFSFCSQLAAYSMNRDFGSACNTPDITPIQVPLIPVRSNTSTPSKSLYADDGPLGDEIDVEHLFSPNTVMSALEGVEYGSPARLFSPPPPNESPMC